MMGKVSNALFQWRDQQVSMSIKSFARLVSWPCKGYLYVCLCIDFCSDTCAHEGNGASPHDTYCFLHNFHGVRSIHIISPMTSTTKMCIAKGRSYKAVIACMHKLLGMSFDDIMLLNWRHSSIVEKNIALTNLHERIPKFESWRCFAALNTWAYGPHAQAQEISCLGSSGWDKRSRPPCFPKHIWDKEEEDYHTKWEKISHHRRENQNQWKKIETSCLRSGGAATFHG